MRLKVDAPGGFVAELVLHYEQGGGLHSLKLRAPNVPLDAETLGDKSAIQIDSGNATVTVDGPFNAEEIDLSVVLELTELKARPRPGKPMLGLDNKTAGEMLENITEWKLAVGLKGPLSAPRLVIDDEQVLASLQGALTEAGKNMLAKEAGKQLEKRGLEDKVGKDVLDGLGGLLGTKKKDDGDKDDEKDKKKKDGLGGLLDGVLR